MSIQGGYQTFTKDVENLSPVLRIPEERDTFWDDTVTGVCRRVVTGAGVVMIGAGVITNLVSVAMYLHCNPKTTDCETLKYVTVGSFFFEIPAAVLFCCSVPNWRCYGE